MNNMFCFQCQEACRNTGCSAVGMCGKKAETAILMDAIIRQLKLLALNRNVDRKLGRFVSKSLFMTITNANFDNDMLQKQLDEYCLSFHYHCLSFCVWSIFACYSQYQLLQHSGGRPVPDSGVYYQRCNREWYDTEYQQRHQRD